MIKITSSDSSVISPLVINTVTIPELKVENLSGVGAYLMFADNTTTDSTVQVGATGNTLQLKTNSTVQLGISNTGAATFTSTITAANAIFADTAGSGLPLIIQRPINTATFGINFDWQLFNSSNAYVSYARIQSQIVSNAAGAETGTLSFQTRGSGTLGVAITINSNQQILIGGSSNPGGAKVYTLGDMAIDSSNASSQLYFYNSQTELGSIGKGSVAVSGGDATGIGIGSIGKIVFGTGGVSPTLAMTIDTSQNVGVGSSPADSRFDVTVPGATRVMSLRHTGSLAGSTTGALQLGDPSTITNGTGIYFRTSGEASMSAAGSTGFFTWYTNGSQRLKIDATGAILVGNISVLSGAPGAGEIGLANNNAIRWKNAAGTAFLNTIYVDGSNNLQLGGGGATSNAIIATSGIGTVATFDTSGNSTFSSGGVFLTGGITSTGANSNGIATELVDNATGTQINNGQTATWVFPNTGSNNASGVVLVACGSTTECAAYIVYNTTATLFAGALSSVTVTFNGGNFHVQNNKGVAQFFQVMFLRAT